MTVTAPTLDSITGNTVMVKMRELIKQMTVFAKEVADLVNTIPTDIQDTYSREAIDEMLQEIDDAIDAITGDITSLMEDKANASDVYTKSETDTLLTDKANASNVYTKSETDNLISPKANASDVYTKSETDTLLTDKANTSDVYTKSETDNLLSVKQNELTAGTGITINNNVISTNISGANIIPLQVSNLNNPNSAPLLENVLEGDMVFVTFRANYNTYSAVFQYSNKSEYMTILANENPGNNRRFYDVALTSDGGSPIAYRRFEFDITTVDVNASTSTTVRQTIDQMTGNIIRAVA